MLRKGTGVLTVYFNSHVVGFLCMGGNLKDPIEKFLRRFAVDPVPDILGGKVVLAQDILRQ